MAAYLDACGKDAMEGYGFWWMLLEIVADQMAKGDDKCSVTYSLPQWSHHLYCHHNKVGKYLGKLEVTGLVTVKSDKGKIEVTIHNLLKYRDEYSRKSGQSQERVRTKKQNTDTDTDTDNKKPLSAVADVALEIILSDKSLHPISRQDVDDWIRTYPKVDVIDVLSKIHQRCLRSESKRKSAVSIRPHIVGCLEMMQKREAEFDRIWKRYPVKDGRKEAERHFRATVHTEDDLRDIHHGLDNYLALLAKTPDRPAKNGSTWFNNWRDWVDYEPAKEIKHETVKPKRNNHAHRVANADYSKDERIVEF
jgi:hypothetical protein